MTTSTLVEDDRGQIVPSVDTDVTSSTAYAAFQLATSVQTQANSNTGRISILEGRADQFDVDLNAVEATANAALAASSGPGKLELTGGTMTGFITLHADPTNPYHAATKFYVDGAISTSLANYYTVSQTYSRTEMDSRYVQRSGSTMTGPLTLNANPSSALHAATKQYVDTLSLPAGVIVMWSGNVAGIPSGWALCNGANGTPDLRNRFIIGAGSSYNPSATGGSTSHTHTITVAGTALTTAQMPSHSHSISDPGHAHSISDPGHAHSMTLGNSVLGVSSVVIPQAINAPTSNGYATAANGTGISVISSLTGISISANGSGQSHTHTATEDAQSHMPPYYALAFIMKL